MFWYLWSCTIFTKGTSNSSLNKNQGNAVALTWLFDFEVQQVGWCSLGFKMHNIFLFTTTGLFQTLNLSSITGKQLIWSSENHFCFPFVEINYLLILEIPVPPGLISYIRKHGCTIDDGLFRLQLEDRKIIKSLQTFYLISLLLEPICIEPLLQPRDVLDWPWGLCKYNSQEDSRGPRGNPRRSVHGWLENYSQVGQLDIQSFCSANNVLIFYKSLFCPSKTEK